MKKFLIVFGLGVMLTGCGDEQQEFKTIDPAQLNGDDIIAEDKTWEKGDKFLFKADDNGLILRGQGIEKVVTEKPVKDAEIVDGILKFKENIGETWEVRTVNLEAFEEFLETIKN